MREALPHSLHLLHSSTAMRWLDADGTEREAEWQEPADPKQPNEDVCATDQEEKYVWAVPTQEGFALQLNSLLSVLTLARRLKRTAVLMPAVYGAALSTRRCDEAPAADAEDRCLHKYQRHARARSRTIRAF